MFKAKSFAIYIKIYPIMNTQNIIIPIKIAPSITCMNKNEAITANNKPIITNPIKYLKFSKNPSNPLSIILNKHIKAWRPVGIRIT